jgi:hypothetical protein
MEFILKHDSYESVPETIIIIIIITTKTSYAV